MIMNLVVVNMLGKGGILYSSCLFGKYVFALSFGVWFVIVLGFQLFVNWYLFLGLWRGREAEANLSWRCCFGRGIKFVSIV